MQNEIASLIQNLSSAVKGFAGSLEHPGQAPLKQWCDNLVAQAEEQLARPECRYLAGELRVEYSTRDGVEYLTSPISGWDEVSKLTKRVLLFQGNRFTFSCWNSDANYCVFKRIVCAEPNVAKFI